MHFGQADNIAAYHIKMGQCARQAYRFGQTMFGQAAIGTGLDIGMENEGPRCRPLAFIGGYSGAFDVIVGPEIVTIVFG